MTDYNLHLVNQTVGNAVNFFEHTPLGYSDAVLLGGQFSSATALLNHTQPLGNESVVHLLTGDTFSVNLPKRTFGAVVRNVASYFGLNQ